MTSSHRKSRIHQPDRTTKRVAIYLRISTDEKNQPFSLEAQETKLLAFITSQDGWELTSKYVDQASGATTDRPQLQRALTAARAGKFDILLVYRLDRLTRSLRGLTELLETLDKAGVAFRSATEPFDTGNATGRMIIQILGVIAEFERALIIDRVINGMEVKASLGQWQGGSRPYGYQIDPNTDHLTVDPVEAPIVRRIFTEYVNDRLGSQAIARKLTSDGLRTKTGLPWSPAAILTILRNRVYLGYITFRDVEHAAPHPTIIDPDLFHQAQKILAERAKSTATKRAASGSDYLLTGKIRCAQCGRHYIGTAARGNLYRYRYYSCWTRNRYGTSICPAERLPAEQVDAAILNAMIETYAGSGLVTEAAASLAGRIADTRAAHRDELATVDSEISKAETAIDRYFNAFEAGTMTDALVGGRIEKLTIKIKELQGRRAELVEHLADDATQPVPPTAADLTRLSTQIADAIRDGAPATLRRLTDALVAEITVTSRSHIQPTFRIPTQSAAPTGGSDSGQDGTQPSSDGTEVRAIHGSVRPAGIEPATQCLEAIEPGAEC
ncbi:hypothetical protein CcI49_07510 [Frankia sp. CcI49]|uniref:recombinase family protein n=1 Tax=Frankia sp. CcI49 TaxID=1745382 RepID=UPI000976B61F|nr:recombinase family protein [Frankia sp. CcI49]ONH61410.1 hypothetical protein CcI49_07510 [Frankia sp. CcI49]